MFHKILTLGLMWMAVAAPTTAWGPAQELRTLAFGSCNMQRLPQDHWKVISALKPDLWIWAGDAIYADQLPPSLQKGEWQALKNQKFYASFRKSTPIIGVWDDHDYGYNNVGGEFKNKREAQKNILEFLDEPAGSPRWSQDGIYASYVYGPVGKQVKVILLDVRWFREKPGTEASILGPWQWTWLESEIKHSTAQLHFIVSGSQVLAVDKGGDRWEQYSREKQKLLNLIDESGVKTVLLSGDVHLAEISRQKLGRGWIYDFTSSGMTHANGSGDKGQSNKLIVGERVTQNNFGTLQLDWSGSSPTVTLEIRSAKDGKIFQKHTIEN